MTATATIPDGIPGFSFVWLVVTIAAFVGGVVAYRRKQRDPEYDAFVLVTRYSIWGAIIGLILLGLLGVLL